jgi:bacterioferritin
MLCKIQARISLTHSQTQIHSQCSKQDIPNTLSQMLLRAQSVEKRVMSDQVVDLLRKAYSDEIETVMNYQTNAIVLDGVRAEEIKESLQQDIQEELAHAEQLGQRLKQLNARPPASSEFTARQDSLQPPDDSTDVLAVINGVLDAEEGAIDTYSALIDAAEAAGDPVTEDLAVTILADEEAHRTEFRGFKKEYQTD